MGHHSRLVQDRDVRSLRSAFIRAKKLAIQYAARLRKIARHVGDIVRGFDPGTIQGRTFIQASLRRYADAITPWAEATAERMVAEVAASDRVSWRKVSAQMGRALHKEIETAPTGTAMRAIKAEQVTLIRSLPLEAAERVHRITTEGISKGMRADEVAAEIMRTGEVTKSRANLIARTEVARTATALTQARAEHIGSTGYQWLTAQDEDVRPSHRKMNGQFVRWDSPPTLDGMVGHAGCLPNCRCTVLPVLPKI